jgi:hypothetical protein
MMKFGTIAAAAAAGNNARVCAEEDAPSQFPIHFSVSAP